MYCIRERDFGELIAGVTEKMVKIVINSIFLLSNASDCLFNACLVPMFTFRLQLYVIHISDARNSESVCKSMTTLRTFFSETKLNQHRTQNTTNLTRFPSVYQIKRGMGNRGNHLGTNQSTTVTKGRVIRGDKRMEERLEAIG
jgi:hypothetical protein